MEFMPRLSQKIELSCSDTYEKKDREKQDLISLLPREIAVQILCHLDPEDLLRMAQTSHYWKGFLDDEFIWEFKYREKHYREPVKYPWSRPFEWKVQFIRNFLLEKRWRVLSKTPLRRLEGQFYEAFQPYSDDRVVMRRGFSTLVAYNTQSGEWMWDFEGHEFAVLCLQVSGSLVASGSSDCTIRLWSLDTGKCTHILRGHELAVRCLHVNGFRIVSGSTDRTVRYWDTRHGKLIFTFVGHTQPVEFVKLSDKMVVSADINATIKVWDLGPKKCLLHSLQHAWPTINYLFFNGRQIVSGWEQTAFAIDLGRDARKHAFSINSLPCLKLNGEIMAAAHGCETKLWNLDSGKLEGRFYEKKIFSEAATVDFNMFFVFSAHHDGNIYLWERYGGKFVRKLNFQVVDICLLTACDDKLLITAGRRNFLIHSNIFVYHVDHTYDDHRNTNKTKRRAKTH